MLVIKSAYDVPPNPNFSSNYSFEMKNMNNATWAPGTIITRPDNILMDVISSIFTIIFLLMTNQSTARLNKKHLIAFIALKKKRKFVNSELR